jgi:type IV pilus assembly protein PilA
MIALPYLTERWRSILIWAVLLLAAVGAVRFAIGLGFLAIPMFGSKKAYHERAALDSMRAIQRAELVYESTYPANGFACTLADLGGDSSAGAPSPRAARILQSELSSGVKSGYVFLLKCTDRVTKNGIYRNDKFAVTAVPQSVGETGTRGFCGDQFGNIQYDPAGGSNCTQPIE